MLSYFCDLLLLSIALNYPLEFLLHITYVTRVVVVAGSQVGLLILDDIQVACVWILASDDLDLFLCAETRRGAVE